ncbi:hypothetical protein LCGC14_1417570 [marine sediment metagenome]|uniref:30S ribosomal protein S21 n=1 Tax=marine sediment metagenome TaxID=412755 RepID=A0A0F9KDK4_9ZZZZ
MSRPSSMVVIGEGRRGFDASLRRFLKMTSDVVSEAKRRQYFRPTPTRNARRLRGKILEKRKQEREDDPSRS